LISKRNGTFVEADHDRITPGGEKGTDRVSMLRYLRKETWKEIVEITP